MDIGKGTDPHKYDTFVDLNHPPMKTGGYDISNQTPGRFSKSRPAPVATLSASHRPEPDAGGGFNFHLGGLSRG